MSVVANRTRAVVACACACDWFDGVVGVEVEAVEIMEVRPLRALEMVR